MTTKDEALREARVVLMEADEDFDTEGFHPEGAYRKPIRAAIALIDAALSEKAEAVAWLNPNADQDGTSRVISDALLKAHPEYRAQFTVPLYTHPTQQPEAQAEHNDETCPYATIVQYHEAAIRRLEAALAAAQQPAPQPVEPWRVRMICCGNDAGTREFPTWEAADKFREEYTSGYGVHPNGYSAPKHAGEHKRAAIVERIAAAPQPADERGAKS